MRDAFIVLLFAVACGWALWKKDPFMAIMIYFWISFMNPHRFTWGFAYSLPLAMAAAAVTFISLILGFNKLKWPGVLPFYLFLIYWAFITLTNFTAMYPEDAWAAWGVINKIFLMTLLAMIIINNKLKLQWFMLGIVVYIGSVGVKGAIFGLATGGQYTVWGPPETFLEDNNGLGLALIIILPLTFYAKDLLHRKWQKLAALWITFSIALSALLTYSRGALLGMVAVSFFLVLRSKHKAAISALFVVIIGIGVNFLPDSWFERMSSIQSFNEDRSAQMRLNSWKTAYFLAKDRPLGGGFDCFSLEMYELYSPNPELGKRRAGGGSTAHSIYFELMAYHGFGGLFFYLLMVGILYFSLGKLEKTFIRVPQLEWISIMSRATRISIVGFMVSGAFLSRAYFDLFWAVYALGVGLIFYVKSGAWLQEIEDEEEQASVDNQVESSETEVLAAIGQSAN